MSTSSPSTSQRCDSPEVPGTDARPRHVKPQILTSKKASRKELDKQRQYLGMDEEAAARCVQRHCRAFLARQKVPFNLAQRVNLPYELHVISTRLKRRRAVYGFVRDSIFLLLLCTVLWAQRSVQQRFELERTLQGFMQEIETPEGLSFEGIESLDDFWEFAQHGFYDAIVSRGASGARIRTCAPLPTPFSHVLLHADPCTRGAADNQLVGTVRLESTLVGSDSCAWQQHGSASDLIWRVSGYDAECYGSSGGSVEPFGPWYDPTRFKPEPGSRTFVVDLGTDPKWAALKLDELRRVGFLSERTREVNIAMGVYNHALLMFAMMRMQLRLGVSGQMSKAYQVRSVNVQEYAASMTSWRLVCEVLLLLFTIASTANLGLRALRRSSRVHITPLYAFVDVARTFLLLVCLVLWLLGLRGLEHIDLQTRDFVDLSSQAAIASTYYLAGSAAIVLSLLRTLEHFASVPKLAAIVSSVSSVSGELGWFFVLFSMFFFTFALIGHLILGPSLPEWSVLLDVQYGGESAINSCFDMMTGNYMLESIARASYGGNDLALSLSGIIFYFSFIILMFFMMLNVLLAILMDGYANVKSSGTSPASEALNAHVGGLKDDFGRAARLWLVAARNLLGSCLRVRRGPSGVWTGGAKRADGEVVLFWGEGRWEAELAAVIVARRKAGKSCRNVKLSAFAAELRALHVARAPAADVAKPRTMLLTTARRALAQRVSRITTGGGATPEAQIFEQVMHRFNNSVVHPPSHTNADFASESTEDVVQRMAEEMARQGKEMRKFRTLMIDALGTLAAAEDTPRANGAAARQPAAAAALRRLSTASDSSASLTA